MESANEWNHQHNEPNRANQEQQRELHPIGAQQPNQIVTTPSNAMVAPNPRTSTQEQQGVCPTADRPDGPKAHSPFFNLLWATFETEPTNSPPSPTRVPCSPSPKTFVFLQKRDRTISTANGINLRENFERVCLPAYLPASLQDVGVVKENP